MKSNSILTLALMISGVLPGFFGVVYTVTPPPITAKAPLVRTTSNYNDVQLEITVPASVQTEQSVELIITLKNRSSQAIVYPEIDLVHELGINVLNDSESTPEMTELGKARLLGNPYKYASEVLQPGQDHLWRVDLNGLFYLTPGKYRVSARIVLNRDLPHPFYISTGSIEFATTAAVKVDAPANGASTTSPPRPQ